MTETKLPVVAVIPSLNPDEKLLGTVHGLQAQGFDQIILVDDGSRDACRPCFDQLEAEGCRVLRHEVNRGKGRALKTAFAAYLQDYDLAEYVGVVTADADGQHLPEDIRKTAEALVQSATGEQSAPPLWTAGSGHPEFRRTPGALQKPERQQDHHRGVPAAVRQAHQRYPDGPPGHIQRFSAYLPGSKGGAVRI